MEAKDKTFEEMLNELEQIVKDLETGDVDLDNAIKKYTEGMKLAKSCNEKLSNATAQVNKILTDNGKLEDFNIEE